MSRHIAVVKLAYCQRLSRVKVSLSNSWLLWLISLLTLTTLACGFLGGNSGPTANYIIIRDRLPTLTPTLLAVLAPTVASPSDPAVAVAAAPEQAAPLALPATAAPAVVEAAPLPAPAPNQNIEPANPAVEAPPALALEAPPVPPVEVFTPTPLPTPTVAATATETPTPTSVPTEAPTATPSPTPAAWLFAGVRLAPAPDGSGLLLYGDAINNTGASQTLQFIGATFFDAQGQVLAPANLTDYWPTEAVPPGGQIPFELSVAGIPNPANFNLNAEAVPSDQTPRQDFEFSDLNQSNDTGSYCLSGRLRDQGSELNEYLVIVAILYDAQNNVVNFSDYYESDPEAEIDEHTLDFDLCVDPLGQNIARHELRAWGL
jgi:hypothetical protein